MKRWLSRDILVLALTVLVLATPVIAGGLYVYNKHQWALARLAELEPRYARFIGMEAGQKELAKATEHAQSLLQQYVYPQDKDLNQAGNDAQQRVRDILSAAGLQVGSIHEALHLSHPLAVDCAVDRHTGDHVVPPRWESAQYPLAAARGANPRLCNHGANVGGSQTG